MELMLKDYPSELDIGTSMASFQNAMELQKQLFHSQIDELKNIVVTQCKLTGVNPLSQEMAAGALSIKIGKRPRELLNPKAVKYMQAVFSIKDAISKKESREIGALFGLTVTQVREYFASQRTRVRKMVRLSREKAIRASATKELKDGLSADADAVLPIEPVPLNSVGPSVTEEAASCSNQDELLAGLGDSDKQFVENIFNSMRKEETFSGQVKLMEWVLQIQNPSVLSWFLSQGGVMILATWLSQAAGEEQTSVLSSTLKVLCHLPLHKALPGHMSAILQGVNRLRFYRLPDISNRARVLLSKWSKMFAKSQALKKPNGIRTSGAQQEIDLSQRIDELMGDWQSSIVNHDGTLVPSYGSSDYKRKLETPEDIKLLTASSDDTNKKHTLGPCSHNKERRKVLLVEQPGKKTSSKNQQVKAVPANHARPITADEIQKAKLRAQFMQSNKTKTEGLKRPSLLTNDLLSASEAYLRPKLEAQKKRLLPVTPKKIKLEEPPKSIKREEPPKCIKQEEPPKEKPIFDEKESWLDKCQRVQIPWQAPPEVELDPDWGVGRGENSKEIEVQKNRMRREKESIYRSLQEVPLNPKEPWDTEMDFDDTLTPEIPIEQLPDPDGVDDTPSNTQEPEFQDLSVASGNAASTSSQPAAEPDLELLAVLLKNPELVFALTSGQASGISSEDTVRLLDMLKASGGGAALLNGQVPQPERRVEVSLPSPTPTPGRNVVEVSLPSPTPPSRVEVSLPSPTPSSHLPPSGWTSENAKNPFSRQPMPAVATTVTVADRPQSSSTVQSQFTSATAVPSLLHPSSQPPISAFRSSSFIPENQPVSAMNQTPPTNYHLTNPSVNNLSSTVPTMPGASYQRLQAHRQLSHPPEYYVPEDNMGLINNRNHGLAHNFSSTHGSQNAYNPITRGSGPAMRSGPTWERSEFNPGGHKGGFESWSPENSPDPSGYVQSDHGHGWSYPEQRGYGHGPPSDRLGRRQDSSGLREHHWQGGGRRWHEGDWRR